MLQLLTKKWVRCPMMTRPGQHIDLRGKKSLFISEDYDLPHNNAKRKLFMLDHHLCPQPWWWSALQGWKLSNIVVVRQHWQLGASAYTCCSVHRAKGIHYGDLISMVLEFTMLVEYIMVRVEHLISWPHYVVLQHYGYQDQHGAPHVLHNV